MVAPPPLRRHALPRDVHAAALRDCGDRFPPPLRRHALPRDVHAAALRDCGDRPA